MIDKIEKEIEIPAGSDYYIKFSSENFTFEEKNIETYSSGLSEKAIEAIVKSPEWIQRKLTRQFKSIDCEEYADLIINISKKYTDEIAFSIAACSLGQIPSAEVIKENVLTLYENDKWIKYADIIDYDDNQGNYFSTIKYKVIENGTIKQLEYPPEIYYWNVVHPEIIFRAEKVYGKFWRDYLLNHNDLGYPLLKEKLSNINYLWDCKTYSQPKNRLWDWSMDNHPTAIEAISYWVGKTVPEQAIGDRPGQPSVVAHEHNGWCGELKTIAVAAQSTGLIPTMSVNNAGEDHVWREFYERGWHQIDNWWSDGGGTVDNPEVYAYGWGKQMSAIFADKGDKSIYEVTPTYIRKEDRKTISFNVLDRGFNPVDGARVTVTVKGPNDVTWLKYQLLEKVENIWDKIPTFLKGKILQLLYNKITDKINNIPDIIDGPIHSVWNYTDVNGKCSFELGKNHSYFFIIQYGNLKNPMQLAKVNKLRILKNPIDKEYKVWLPLLSTNKYKHSEQKIPNGNISFRVSYDTIAYQVQKNIFDSKNGVYENNGKIDFFIVDETNFNKYKDGLNFKCHNFRSNNNDKIFENITENDWYFVFRNNCRKSNLILNYSASVGMHITDDRIRIADPDTNIFDNPIFNVGETVNIKGIATNDIVYLYINELPIEVIVDNDKWSYEWDTAGFEPRDYLILAESGNSQDEIMIKLIDVIPPDIKIQSPFDNEIIDSNNLQIKGNSSDNQGLNRIEISFNNSEWIEADGKENWSIDLDISSYDIGNYLISARAFDLNGCFLTDKISIIINETGHSWGPQINGFYNKPDNPSNVNNVIVYANVTKANPFSIQKVVLCLCDGFVTKKTDMFRYADNPAQERHEEDPLKNMSNKPIYGLELGQFPTGTNLTYWIETYDKANNKIISESKYLIIK